jgi:Zn-dependent peptidase ImmA (M78 family)
VLIDENHVHEGYLLGNLRALMPDADLSLAELFDLIERLAAAIRLDAPVTTDHMPDDVATRVCRLRLEESDLPIAGICYWDPADHVWVIARSSADSPETRRFTLWHELGHIVWHGWGKRLFPGMSRENRLRLNELAADFFAGEVLMPRRLLERAFSTGLHDPAELARRFDVSEDAMRWKLAQTDLPFVSSEDQATTTYPYTHAIVPPLVDLAPHGTNSNPERRTPT